MPAGFALVTDLDDDTVAHARLALERALAPGLRDDRFADAWVAAVRQGTPFVAAHRGRADGPAAYLGGTVDGARLRLDALVEPGEVDRVQLLDELLAAVLERAPALGARDVELWGHPGEPFHQAVAEAHGMVPVRALHQMRCPLPVAADELPTRPFRPGADDAAVLAVNNRAFQHHPDQGGLAMEDLRGRFREPWFDPDGLRVHERDGRIIGFCWTKIHHDADLGEIYVIGIDPDFHGQRLGVPMTAAGLHWLHGRGLRTGMLYVEADNVPAVRTYERLGFSPFRTDRAWRLTLG